MDDLLKELDAIQTNDPDTAPRLLAFEVNQLPTSLLFDAMNPKGDDLVGLECACSADFAARVEVFH
jgi:hypothetical protein